MSTGVATGIVSGVDVERARVGAARTRVLVTGFDRPTGRSVAEAMALAGARLVLQADDASDAVEAAAGRLAGRAVSVSLVSEPLGRTSSAQAVTRSAVGALGGIDTLVVVLDLDANDLSDPSARRDTEGFLAGWLGRALDLIRSAANRMDLTWTKGSVIVVLATPDRLDARAALVAQLLRAGLAGLVRREADRLAPADIRVAGVVTSDAADAGPCTPDVVDLVLRLARRDGEQPAGLVYDAVAAI